jgi:dihydroorotate dehydrogenase (fumarate)
MGVLNRGDGARSTTFYSVEGHARFTEEEYAEEVAKAKATVDIPVIASLTCLNDDDWVRRSALIAQAGADALELDISCPHGAHMLIGGNSLSEVERVTALVKSSISIPVIPKLTPQSSDPVEAALDAQRANGDAVVMFNRFTGLDIDIETQQPILHGGLAGHGGPWAIYYAMRWISTIYPRIEIPISASGGVWSGEDVAKMLLAGATTVQTCTAVIIEGYGVVEKQVRALEAYMDRMGHSTIADFRGRAAKRLQHAAIIDRTRQFKAEIDVALCSDCGKCAEVCIYDAASPSDHGGYQIDDRCAGCNLCSQLCPTGAISVYEVSG